MHSRSQRFSFALLFLASISAALPVVRFCPLRWDEIDLAAYATCTAMPTSGECRPPSRRVAGSAAHGCGAMAECPMRARAGDASTQCVAACPPHASSAAAPPPARPDPDHHAGPGWCFAEPLIAAATRAHAPAAPSPFAIAATIVRIEIPAPVQPVAPATDARPPTAPSLAPPSIRGPPSLLS
jgi:hypothetical protein